jgi:hypothetical protein
MQIVRKEPESASPSMRRTFMACPKKFDWQFNHKLVPRAYNRAFGFGSMGHRLLEAYYRHGIDAIGATVDAIRLEWVEKQLDSYVLQMAETDLFALQGMIVGYLQNYHDTDSNWEIIGLEERYQSDSFGLYMQDGKPDIVIRDKNGHIWVGDHKFYSRLSESFVRTLTFDDQVNSYAKLVSEFLGPVRGILYNVVLKPTKRLKKKQTLSEFQREIALDYQKDPEKYFKREWVVLGSKHREAFEKNVLHVERTIHRSYEDDFFTKNPNECFSRGQCPYLELCVSGESAKHLYEIKKDYKEEDAKTQGEKDQP